MEWITVIGLIVLGIALIVAEIIFIPGTTIVGICGFISGSAGVYLGYDYFGNTAGNIILILSVIVSTIMTVYSFRSKAWERFSLKEQNTGKFNDDFRVSITVGAEGLTISSLKPVGKAIFQDNIIVEVKSNGGFIKENHKIKVIRTDANKIIVEPI